MKQILPKQAPLRLEQQDYQNLRDQVLRRDGWCCQLCGSISNLEVHHREFRSHGCADDERNLITLWACGRMISLKSDFAVQAAKRAVLTGVCFWPSMTLGHRIQPSRGGRAV